MKLNETSIPELSTIDLRDRVSKSGSEIKERNSVLWVTQWNITIDFTPDFLQIFWQWGDNSEIEFSIGYRINQAQVNLTCSSGSSDYYIWYAYHGILLVPHHMTAHGGTTLRHPKSYILSA